MAGNIIAQREKRCGSCSVEKPLHEFGKHARSRDGLSTSCKACLRAYFAAYREANRESERERARKWAAKHPGSASARRRKCLTENPGKAREYEARYAAKHPERVSTARAKYRAAGAAAAKVKRKEWAAANKHLVCAKSAARRALKVRATPAWADKSAIYAEARRISEETGAPHHVDHCVPLKSHLVCGLHCEANLQILPGAENLKKLNRKWPDMP